MNKKLEYLPRPTPRSVRLLTFWLDHPPILGILQSFLTPSEILLARRVSSQWSYCFELPQFKIQSPPSQSRNQNQNQQGGRRILIEQFNSNIYGSGSGRGDFVDKIPIQPCRISILIDNCTVFRPLSQFLNDNQPLNPFITHLTLARCYAYETNPNQNPNRNQNSNWNGSRSRNQDGNRNVDTRTPLLTLHEFFMLIFSQLHNLEYLSIDRIPLNWTRVNHAELVQLANLRQILPNSRSSSSLRTLVFSHGWLNLRDESFLLSFLGLFPHLQEIWGMSLKCCESVKDSRKTRVLKSIILEGSKLSFLFKRALEKFVGWAVKPRLGVELQEIKFNMELYWNQNQEVDKYRMAHEFSSLLNYHCDSLKSLLIQPLAFWFPALFSSFPVFSQVTTLKFSGKSVFTETESRTQSGTMLVEEESYAFFPLNLDSDSDSDFKLTRHFPNLRNVKISFYFPNHSRNSSTVLDYCFPLPSNLNLNLIHKGVKKLELVDLAGLINSDVIQRFSILFPNVENLTLKKSATDRQFASGLSAIFMGWPRLKELQCKLMYKTGNLANLENWDSAITGFSEGVCDELRRNPDQNYRVEMEQRRQNSTSILRMTEMKKFILVFTTNLPVTSSQIVNAAVNRNGNGRGSGFMTSVSWNYGYNLLPKLELVVIFGKFCRGFERKLWRMETSNRLKVIDEALP